MGGEMKIRDKKAIINNFLKMGTLIDTLYSANVLADEKSAVGTLEFPAGTINIGFSETGVSFANTSYVLESCKGSMAL